MMIPKWCHSYERKIIMNIFRLKDERPTKVIERLKLQEDEQGFRFRLGKKERVFAGPRRRNAKRPLPSWLKWEKRN